MGASTCLYVRTVLRVLELGLPNKEKLGVPRIQEMRVAKINNK